MKIEHEQYFRRYDMAWHDVTWHDITWFLQDFLFFDLKQHETVHLPIKITIVMKNGCLKCFRKHHMTWHDMASEMTWHDFGWIYFSQNNGNSAPLI